MVTKGFGIELKSYEQAIGGTDLTNCILSVVQVNNVFNYATVYMDNALVFDDKEKLLLLTKHILAIKNNILQKHETYLACSIFSFCV